MNRQEALEYGKTLGIKPSTYGEQCVMVDTILALQVGNCNLGSFDYCGCSIQDSILQVDPTATFDIFSCNNFKCK